ncbi:MAG: multidrug resistance transporter, Bcr family [Burkholderiales bacterium]|jgi:multidrug resistance protein|nr:multidrug resistance transporter, Bcr family [Burkholderiales bacterium]
MAPLGQISIDFYSTSLPIIAQYFKVSYNSIGVITTSFLIAYGVGQLLHGLFCDIVGRKRLLVITLPFYIVATLYIPFCKTIFLIAAMRLIQGFSIAAVSVTVKSIASDLFKAEKLVKAVSLITIVWGLSPILAPLLGGVIQSFLGWKWCFYTLGVMSLIIYITVLLFLPETIEVRNTLVPKNIINKYLLLFKHNAFIIHLTYINLAILGLLTFILQTPYLIQGVYHFTPIGNGLLFLCVSFIYLFGTQLSSKLSNLKSAYSIPIIILIIAMIAYISNMFLINNKFLFLSFTTIIMFICGAMLPFNLSKCLQLFPSDSGLVSGFIGLVTLVTPGILFSLLSALSIGVTQRFPFTMLFSSAITLLVIFIFGGRINLIEARNE